VIRPGPVDGAGAEDPLDAVASETPPPLSLDEPDAPAPTLASGGLAVAGGHDLVPLYSAAVAVLTWGFRLGAALLAVGIALALVRGEPLNREANPFSEVLPAVLDGRAAGVVDLAILWFMVTPVATVVVVAAGFLRAGDRRYALLSLLVLAVLGVSIALAL
jgi:uncharacterized membrane protein